MHSHLLPGIDDGSQSINESIELIKGLVELGYEKIITTPHIIGDFYPNTPDIIKGKVQLLREELKKEGIDIKLEAAAEYYLDEFFYKSLEKGDEILTFGDKYLLFETSFLNPNAQIHQIIFMLQSAGITPVMAHPERYVYLYNDYENLQELHDRGVKFQININSISGYYSKQAKEVTKKLIKDGIISFLGSDCHNIKHLNILRETMNLPLFSEATQLNLLNSSLMN